MNTRKEIVILKLGIQAVLSEIGDIHYQPSTLTFKVMFVEIKKKKKKMSGVITSMSLVLRKAVVFLSTETAVSQTVTIRTIWPAGWVTDFPSH